jgi:hypothetical protein
MAFDKLAVLKKIGQGGASAQLASTTTGATGGVAKSLSAISTVPGYEDSLSLSRGVSAAGFNAIKKSFKPMEAGVPQNLTELKKESETITAIAATEVDPKGALDNLKNKGSSVSASSVGAGAVGNSLTGSVSSVTGGVASLSTNITSGATASAVSTATNAVSSLSSSATSLTQTGGLANAAKQVQQGAQSAASSAVATGMSSLPGGSATASSVVNNTKGASNLVSKSIGALTKTATDLATSAFNGSLALPKIPGGAALGGLASGALKGLPPGIQAQLQSALSSLTSGGGSTIKLPTVAFNTFNRSGITGQINSVLGNPIIPRPAVLGEIFPTGSVSDIERFAKKRSALGVLLTLLNTKKQKTSVARQAFNAATAQYPKGDVRIAQAKQVWESGLAEEEAIVAEAKAIERELTKAEQPTTLPPVADVADITKGIESLIVAQTLTGTSGSSPAIIPATQTAPSVLSGETTFQFADYGNGLSPTVVATVVDSVAPVVLPVVVPDETPIIVTIPVQDTVEAVMGPVLPPPKQPETTPSGGGGCVVLDTYVPLVETKLFNGRTIRRAWQLQEGYGISLNTADTDLKTYIGSVVFNNVDLQPCVRIGTAQGISLVCSTTAPIFTKESEFIDAPDLLNKEILCMKDDIEFWDEVVSIESVGEMFVSVIGAGDTAFWAGEQDGSYVLHHNSLKSTVDGGTTYKKK